MFINYCEKSGIFVSAISLAAFQLLAQFSKDYYGIFSR